MCSQIMHYNYHHSRVQPFRQLLKNPHGVGTDAQVPLVRVHLVQSVNMLPHSSEARQRRPERTVDLHGCMGRV